MGTPSDHPLRRLLLDAAAGRFPPADLGVEVLPPPPGRADAVVAFSAHNVIAAAVDPEEVRAHLPAGDPAAPMSAPFLAWLGTRLGSPPGALDVVLVAPTAANTDLRLRPAGRARAHRRVQRALRYRSDVRVYRDEDGRGVVILGRGLAGRLEVAIEVDPRARGRGLGTALARAAASVPRGEEPLFAQVSPGNVASLRAFLAAGYRPVCSEVLFLRAGQR
ncbi:MAG TPA: GNAT family N-acetyltransferase [candidate division Zixibacteria bacterium]|nr:GNAT family N-acetyltransferase [candidate division Zixibacteria bacterium]